MKGRFVKNRFPAAICMICGFSLILLFGAFQIFHIGKRSCYYEILFGILLLIISLFLLFHNYKAYIILNENSIEARYALGAKIKCNVCEVAYCRASQNTLTILMKSGRYHHISGCVNAGEVGEYIKERISFDARSFKDDPIGLWKRSEGKNMKDLTVFLFLLVMMFANIFILVLMTDARKMSSFTWADILITAIMGVLELATVILLFIHARRVGKYSLKREYNAYGIRRVIIETHPLPSGSAKCVYADKCYSFRVVICALPRDHEVYYISQIFLKDFHLETVYTSELFESFSEIDVDTSCLVDITDRFAV